MAEQEKILLTQVSRLHLLKLGLLREQEKISRAEAEIIKLKGDLLDLGVELPPNE